MVFSSFQGDMKTSLASRSSFLHDSSRRCLSSFNVSNSSMTTLTVGNTIAATGARGGGLAGGPVTSATTALTTVAATTTTTTAAANTTTTTTIDGRSATTTTPPIATSMSPTTEVTSTPLSGVGGSNRNSPTTGDGVNSNNNSGSNNNNGTSNNDNNSSIDLSSLSSVGSSGSGSLSHGSAIFADKYSSTSNINNRKLALGLSATWSGKPPKTPRPDRALIIFQSVEKGLRECIGLTLSDICMLKASIDEGISISSAQQYKAAERYLKRLEFQLAKVEELKDQYDVHLKMRDGVRSMAHAYVLSKGKDRDSALSSVRSGYKECTDSLCAIESDLESMMGTLLLEMKGIQGYARLCPGDIFEVTIKHGENQKWKTKGKVLKNGDQTWDSHQALFKALLGDVFAIKAVEVRGLGKNVTLGSKFCETKDLFSAHPQLMTISLNAIGTLKLNLIVTWNPLHCVGGQAGGRGLRKSYHSASSSSLLAIGSSRTLPAMMPTSPRMHSRKFVGTLPGDRITEIVDAEYYHHSRTPEDSSSHKSQTNKEPAATVSTSSGSTGSSLHLTGTSGFGSGSGSSYCGSSSIPNSALTSPETENAPSSLQVAKRRSMSATNICPKHGKNRSSSTDAPKSERLTVEVSVHKNPSQETVNSSKEISTIEEDEVDYSTYLYKKRCGNEKYGILSAESAANLYFNIGDTLINLLTSLEDIQGQYSELHVLQQQVLELFNVLKQLRKLKDVRYEKPQSRQKRFVRRNSASSEISMSVESALQCFDFLNNAITDSESESSPEHEKRLASGQTLPREARGFSKDCLVSSPIGKRSLIYSSNPNFSPTNSTPSPVGSPHPLSTGSEQLDIALMSHLTYCQRLMENLGSFGPLRNRELTSLDKLQSQSFALKSLLRLCSNLCQYLVGREEAKDEAHRESREEQYQIQLEKEINYLKSDQRIRKLWDIVSYCASGKREQVGTLLVCVTSGQFAQSLEAYMKAYATANLNSSWSSFGGVAKLITSRVIDAAKFESDCIVTIFQAVIFFAQENASLEHIFKTYAEEASLLDSLHSGDAIEIKQCLTRFRKTLPPKEPLFSVALLLLDDDQLIVRIAETYLLECSKVKSLRTGLVSQFLEGLEADFAAIRQASCMGLMLLNATETVEQLLYISYADTSSTVREQAKATLFSFGESGRRLYEESQLFANGFQGLAVK